MLPQVVLYDMDGTIIDTDHLHLQAWQYTGRRYGFEVSSGQLSKLKGLSGKKTLEALLEVDDHSIISEASQIKFEYLMAHLAEVEILGNFVEAYQRLQEKSIPIGVCTSARQEFVNGVLQKVPALSFLEGKVVWKEMFAEGKPSAEPLWTTFDHLKIPRTAPAIYVGDGFSDYGSAQKAGMPFYYFCPDQEKKDARFPKNVPVISDHRELIPLL